MKIACSCFPTFTIFERINRNCWNNFSVYTAYTVPATLCKVGKVQTNSLSYVKEYYSVWKSQNLFNRNIPTKFQKYNLGFNIDQIKCKHKHWMRIAFVFGIKQTLTNTPKFICACCVYSQTFNCRFLWEWKKKCEQW